jgi:hypothetical protein
MILNFAYLSRIQPVPGALALAGVLDNTLSRVLSNHDPVVPIEFIDVNSNGFDIYMADESKNIREFCDESITDGEEAILIKLIDRPNEPQSNHNIVYMITKSALQQYINDNKIIYPCICANNMDVLTDANFPTDCSPFPSGMGLGDPNVLDIPLYSINELFSRQFNVMKDDLEHVINSQPGKIKGVVLIKTGETHPTFAKMPFHAAVGKLHCNKPGDKVEMVSAAIAPHNYGQAQLGAIKKGQNKNNKKQIQTIINIVSTYRDEILNHYAKKRKTSKKKPSKKKKQSKKIRTVLSSLRKKMKPKKKKKKKSRSSRTKRR